jgi:hypothetical protein
MFKRIIGLGIVGMGASMVAAAATAMNVKRGLVPTMDPAADEIVAVAIFGPLEFHSTSRNFRGGRLECWYGGGVLDLRDAALAPEGATLDVRAVFGGGQILVPTDWKVVSNVRGMGGLQDVREPKGYAAGAPELVIEGLLVAAGFAVMSEMDRGADWQVDRQALLDNDELELDADPTVTVDPAT